MKFHLFLFYRITGYGNLAFHSLFKLDRLVMYLAQAGVTSLSFDKISYENNEDALSMIVNSKYIKEVNCLKFYDCARILDAPIFENYKPSSLDIFSLVQCGITGMLDMVSNCFK